MNLESTVSRLVAGNAAIKAKPRAAATMESFVGHLRTARAKPVDLRRPALAESNDPARLHPGDSRPPPIERIDYARQHIRSSMKKLEANIAKALHRLGFDRGEIKRITHQVMDPVAERVAAAAGKLGEAKHPVRAAYLIVDKAVDSVGNRLARTLHGMGFERPVIAKLVYHATTGLDRA